MRYADGRMPRRRNRARMRKSNLNGLDPFWTVAEKHYTGPKPKELCSRRGCMVPALGLGFYCEKHLLEERLKLALQE